MLTIDFCLSSFTKVIAGFYMGATTQTQKKDIPPSNVQLTCYT